MIPKQYIATSAARLTQAATITDSQPVAIEHKSTNAKLKEFFEKRGVVNVNPFRRRFK